MCFVWTGRSASTRDYLKTLDRWRATNPAAWSRQLAEMSAAAARGAAALRVGDAALWVEVLTDYAGLLRQLGERARLEIWSEPHCRIAGLAAQVGVAYKPCGAGGGDVGVAADQDPGKMHHFMKRVRDSGYSTIELGIDQHGAHAVTTEDTHGNAGI